MLTLSGIHKAYGRHEVLTGLDLSLRAGEIYGLLGPNGAGKSTTLKILTGLVHPDTGSVVVDGHDLARDPRRALARVGAQIDQPAFHGHLSGRANLELLARLVDNPHPIDELLDLVGLDERREQPAGRYSTGMKQRLGIATALLTSPSLLILDEPTAGLDPDGRQGILDLVRGLSGDGLTILFTSHIFDEVARLCDRVGILSGGSLAHEGEVGDADTLRDRYFQHTGGDR